MATTETLSQGSTSSLIFKPTTKLLHPSTLSTRFKALIPSPILLPPSPLPSLQNPHKYNHHLSWKVGSEVPEEFNEVFFDDNHDMMDGEEEMSDEDETESSIDLLIKFL
ncbi:hypothetical protein Peur_018934 [Populus x canadensis]